MSKFRPYADNGGSVVAIAGSDFAVIGADSRLSSGYSMLTRGCDRLAQLAPTAVLGSAGCWCDALTLTRVVRARLQMYLYEHRRAMSTPALAQMLSVELYHKRFFPYYVSNVLAGLDADGKGCVYSYDPIGNYDRSNCQAGGSAGALLQPLLDNQIDRKNILEDGPPEDLTLDRALQILKDAFVSAAERDIHTGDNIYIKIITKDNIRDQVVPLRKD